MVKYDDIMAFAESLLMGDINEKIRIARIEVMQSNPLEVFCRPAKGRVDFRAFESRMAE